MGAGHFLYIPAAIVVGIVVGWVLGTRAARDRIAAELWKRDKAEARRLSRVEHTTGR